MLRSPTHSIAASPFPSSPTYNIASSRREPILVLVFSRSVGEWIHGRIYDTRRDKVFVEYSLRGRPCRKICRNSRHLRLSYIRTRLTADGKIHRKIHRRELAQVISELDDLSKKAHLLRPPVPHDRAVRSAARSAASSAARSTSSLETEKDPDSVILVNFAERFLGNLDPSLGSIVADDMTEEGHFVHCKPLSTKGAEALAGGLGRGRSRDLVRLELNSCSISDTGGQAIAKALRGCPKLRYLSLCNNQLGPASAVALALGLRHCPDLQELLLSENRMEEDGVRAFANFLSGMRCLRALDVRQNGAMGEEGWCCASEALRGSVAQHPNWRSFKLQFVPQYELSDGYF